MATFITILYSLFVGVVVAYAVYSFFAIKEHKKNIKLLESIDEKNQKAFEISDKIIDTQEEIIKVQYSKIAEYKREMEVQDDAIIKMRDTLIQLSPEFAQEYSKIKMSIN